VGIEPLGVVHFLQESRVMHNKPHTAAAKAKMSEKSETPKCEICGEPMPAGEGVFKFHGYSGPCPKSPLPRAEPDWVKAGDGTLHGAIDYWHERAEKAEEENRNLRLHLSDKNRDIEAMGAARVKLDATIVNLNIALEAYRAAHPVPSTN
jgi:hypothetical protein